MRREAVQGLIDAAHEAGAYVSTGGWIEYVLRQGPHAVSSTSVMMVGSGQYSVR